jgi:nucleotide-binding universal stress UspA family protein
METEGFPVEAQAGQAYRRRARFRPHVGYIVAITLFGAIFLSLALSEFHRPSPHGIPVAIVAPATMTGQIEEALGNAVPGGFNLQVFGNEAAAQAAITHNQVDGALIASPDGLRLLVAQAGGTATVTALNTAMTAVATHSGQSLTVTDVVPPTVDDSLALSPFFVMLGILIPSLAAGSASAMVFRRSSPAWGLAAPAVVAIPLGAVAAGIADGIAGLGNYAAIAGIVALFSLAVAAPTAALARISPPLTALAVLAFLVLGLPASGGPSNLAAFGPGFLRVLHPALPLGLGASAVRSAVYFDGYGMAGPLWTLGAWAVGGTAALALVIAWRRRSRVVQVPLEAEAVPALAAAASNGHSRHAGGHGRHTRQAAMMSAAMPSAMPAAMPSAMPSPMPVRVPRDSAWPEPGGAHATVRATTPTAVLPDESGQPWEDRHAPIPPGDVVVGFDNSGPARRALSEATRLVATRPGILHVVYADHMIVDSDLSGFAHAEMEATRDREAAWVADAAADIVAEAGIPYTFERRREAPTDAILSAADALADSPAGGPVILVGQSRHPGLHPLGSVSSHLLHHSPYPVLTIP